MALNVVDVSSLTVAGTSIGLDSASPTKEVAFLAGARQCLIVVEGAPCYMRSDGDAATSADILLGVGDVVPMLGDNMTQALDLLRFIRKTSTSATLKIIWYNREAVLTERIIRGAVRLVAEDGESLVKAEDAAHASGDKGIMALAVRNDDGTPLAGSDGDYIPLTTDQHGNLRIGKPVFGEASLVAANNGNANWAQGVISPLDQKGGSGWLACLYGGVQTGDDWARIDIPVEEVLLPKFTKATSWTYWLSGAQSMGVNIVLWVHDPADPSKRAEITQLANVAGLGKASGWNSHVLNLATTQFFYYGENISGSGLTAGTQYTLAQFQADALFSTYTVYRVTIEWGWEASGTFENAFVADIKINGVVIPLKPDSGGSGQIMIRRVTATSGAIAATLAPKTPFYDLVIALHLNAAPTTATQNFTADVDAGMGSGYDSNLLTLGTVANAVTDLKVETVGRRFYADDEIDVAWANTDNKTYGLTMSCRTVLP